MRQHEFAVSLFEPFFKSQLDSGAEMEKDSAEDSGGDPGSGAARQFKT